MTDVLSLLTASGLAGAAGHRAAVPALLLGVLHHLAAAIAEGGEPFFALGPGWVWLADPLVIGLLVLLLVAELLAESESPELASVAGRVPRLLSGVLVAMAAAGAYDDKASMQLLAGIVGGGVAGGVDFTRATVRELGGDALDAATGGWSSRIMAIVETVWSVVMSVVAVVFPLLVILVLLIPMAMVALSRRRRPPCPSCAKPVHPRATACPHCQTTISRGELSVAS